MWWWGVVVRCGGVKCGDVVKCKVECGVRV